jgi:transposase
MSTVVFLSGERTEHTVMIIGVDPHKSSHTATAIDPSTNTLAGSLRVDASLAGYRELLRWASRFPQRRWAIENARGLGRHLAQWLVARGETVLDVPTTATSRVRELSRGGRRKNDVIDASAAASVAALHGDATVVAVEDHTTVFALLEERRANVASQRARVVNQLHALLRDLVPGGAPTALSATIAAAMLRTVRPVGECERTRKELARDLVRDVRALDASLTDIEKRMAAALAAHQSRL